MKRGNKTQKKYPAPRPCNPPPHKTAKQQKTTASMIIQSEEQQQQQQQQQRRIATISTARVPKCFHLSSFPKGPTLLPLVVAVGCLEHLPLHGGPRRWWVFGGQESIYQVGVSFNPHEGNSHEKLFVYLHGTMDPFGYVFF